MVVRHFHAAQPDVIAVGEPVHVIAAWRCAHRRRCIRLSARAKSSLRRHFDVLLFALHHFALSSPASSARATSSVTSSAGMVAMRLQDLGIDKALRRLGAVKIFARHQRSSARSSLPAQGVGRRHHGQGAVGAGFQRRDHSPITLREISGRAASWISTKSGASFASASSPSRTDSCRVAPPVTGGGRSRPSSARAAKLFLAGADHHLDRLARKTPPPSGAASACPPAVHIVSAGPSRPARPCRRRRSGRQCGTYARVPWQPPDCLTFRRRQQRYFVALRDIMPILLASNDIALNNRQFMVGVLQKLRNAASAESGTGTIANALPMPVMLLGSAAGDPVRQSGGGAVLRHRPARSCASRPWRPDRAAFARCFSWSPRRASATPRPPSATSIFPRPSMASASPTSR